MRLRLVVLLERVETEAQALLREIRLGMLGILLQEFAKLGHGHRIELAVVGRTRHEVLLRILLLRAHWEDKTGEQGKEEQDRCRS